MLYEVIHFRTDDGINYNRWYKLPVPKSSTLQYTWMRPVNDVNTSLFAYPKTYVHIAGFETCKPHKTDH